MKRLLYILTLFVCFSACEDNYSNLPRKAEHTLLMYLPWSGNATPSGGNFNLLSYFYTNIEDIEQSISESGLNAERVLVFISTSPTQASLFEIELFKGKIVRLPLKSYTDPAFTTAEGLASILRDVIGFAPAKTYSMTIGSHGMGWLPVSVASSRNVDLKMHWEMNTPVLTRFFGGTIAQYQTDISTLAQAIAATGVVMEYILFDDCYLSTIEVAYDLRHVAKYIIACPTEIMAHGMPYDLIGQYLLRNPNYEAIVETFYNFYRTYQYPYGTIGIVDTSQLDHMASIMKDINTRFSFDSSLRGTLQKMDGYSPTIFFDYGDYVAKLCTDSELLDRFDTQLARTVPYKRNTGSYYSASTGSPHQIVTYSGVTISDPSTNSLATPKTETAWYKATH